MDSQNHRRFSISHLCYLLNIRVRFIIIPIPNISPGPVYCVWIFSRNKYIVIFSLKTFLAIIKLRIADTLKSLYLLFGVCSRISPTPQNRDPTPLHKILAPKLLWKKQHLKDGFMQWSLMLVWEFPYSALPQQLSSIFRLFTSMEGQTQKSTSGACTYKQ